MLNILIADSRIGIATNKRGDRNLFFNLNSSKFEIKVE